jgi:phosphoglycolate phosphatase
MRKKYRCVIFDLDGTLVNTIADIAASMNHALQKLGYPLHSEDEYLKLVGNGLRNLAYKALPEDARDDETVERAYTEDVAYYREHPADYSKVYPGVRELTAYLNEKRVKLAVLSNKAEAISQEIIGKLFPLETFDIVQGERSGVPRKPDPASTWDILAELDVANKDAIFLGDSEVDIQTAHNAECADVGASWGFRGRVALEKAGADRIIDEPFDLLDIMELKRPQVTNQNLP